MLLHDNLFDLNHIAYLHRETFGADGGGMDAVPVYTTGPSWIESHFDQPDIDCPPFFAAMLGHEGKINRRYGLKLYLPCLHVGGDVFHTGANNEHFVGALKIYHALTPATRTTCHYFFAAGHSWEHPDPKFAEGLVSNIAPAIMEDVVATKLIESMIPHYGGRPGELLLKSDHICVRGRRMFEEMMRAESSEIGAAAAVEPVLIHV